MKSSIITREKFNVPIEGHQKVFLADVSSPRAKKLQEKILEIIKRGDPRKFRNEYMKAVRDLNYYFGELELNHHNLVALVGRTSLLGRVAGDLTYSGTVNYGALGTGTTAPTAADIKLGTEIFRKAPSSIDTSDLSTNGIIVLSFFFSTSDVTNPAISEFGNFIDGSASADSGRLFSHMLFSEVINKTATKTLTVDGEYQMLSA